MALHPAGGVDSVQFLSINLRNHALYTRIVGARPSLPKKSSGACNDGPKPNDGVPRTGVLGTDGRTHFYHRGTSHFHFAFASVMRHECGRESPCSRGESEPPTASSLAEGASGVQLLRGKSVGLSPSELPRISPTPTSQNTGGHDIQVLAAMLSCPRQRRSKTGRPATLPEITTSMLWDILRKPTSGG